MRPDAGSGAAAGPDGRSGPAAASASGPSSSGRSRLTGGAVRHKDPFLDDRPGYLTAIEKAQARSESA